MILSFFCG